MRLSLFVSASFTLCSSASGLVSHQVPCPVPPTLLQRLYISLICFYMSLFQEASLLLLCVWSAAVSRSLCLCILSDWGLFGLRLCESPDPSLSPSACLSPAFIWRLPLAPDPASVSPSPAQPSPTLGPRPRRPDRLCFQRLGAPPPPHLSSPLLTPPARSRLGRPAGVRVQLLSGGPSSPPWPHGCSWRIAAGRWGCP